MASEQLIARQTDALTSMYALTKESLTKSSSPDKIIQQTSLRDEILETMRSLEAVELDSALEMEKRWANVPHAMKNPMTMLLALSPDQFQAAFNKLADSRKWKATTQASKLATLIPIALALDISPLLRKTVNLMKDALQKVRIPAWSPMDIQEIAQPSTLLKSGVTGPQLFAYLTGHRLGDILRIRKACVYRVKAPLIGESISIMIVRGKTVRTTGPYPIHLPTESICAQMILERMKDDSGPYIFLSSETILSETAEDEAVSSMRAALHRRHPLDARALRRGGLSVLSLLGNSGAEIRALSRHTTDDSARIYLGAGLLDTQLAATQHRLIKQLEENLRANSENFSVSPCAGETSHTQLDQ